MKLKHKHCVFDPAYMFFANISICICMNGCLYSFHLCGSIIFDHNEGNFATVEPVKIYLIFYFFFKNAPCLSLSQ